MASARLVQINVALAPTHSPPLTFGDRLKLVTYRFEHGGEQPTDFGMKSSMPSRLSRGGPAALGARVDDD